MTRKKKIILANRLPKDATSSKQSDKLASGKFPFLSKSIYVQAASSSRSDVLGKLGLTPNVGPQWINPSFGLPSAFPQAQLDPPHAHQSTYYLDGPINKVVKPLNGFTSLVGPVLAQKHPWTWTLSLIPSPNPISFFSFYYFC